MQSSATMSRTVVFRACLLLLAVFGLALSRPEPPAKPFVLVPQASELPSARFMPGLRRIHAPVDADYYPRTRSFPHASEGETYLSRPKNLPPSSAEYRDSPLLTYLPPAVRGSLSRHRYMPPAPQEYSMYPSKYFPPAPGEFDY